MTRSWTLWFIAALVMLLVVWLAWGLTTGTPVEVVTAQLAGIVEVVDEQGVTRLPKEHLVTMPFDGRIEAIDLVEGTPVYQGMVVARVVPHDLELSVAEAVANVERLDASIRENDDTTVEQTSLLQAYRFVESTDRTVEAAAERVKAGLAKLDFANTNLQRARALVERNAASDEALNAAELEQVQSSVDYTNDQLTHSALQSIQAATALLPTLLQQNMDRKKLARAVLEEEKQQAEALYQMRLMDQQRGVMRSPIDGVVLERLESNERRIGGGTVLLRLGQLDALEVEADILSQDVVRVRPGDRVQVYGPAIGPQPALGSVARIYPSGFTKVSSLGVEQQRVRVIVALDPAELERLLAEQRLGVGFRVRVQIFTAEKESALVVPRSALFRGPTGQWQVFAVRRGVARLQPVAIGLINDERAEVVDGLTEGEQVVLAPESALADGTRVRPVLSERVASITAVDDARGD